LDLYLLRHGDAGKGAISGGITDAALTQSGKKEIAIIAGSLKALNLRISAILTSPLKRAVQTAKILARVLGIENKISVCGELAPEGNRFELSDRLHRFPQESSILIVGHEPYLTNMIYEVIFQGNKTTLATKTKIRREVGIGAAGGIILKKAGLAKIRLNSTTPHITGELRWLVTPRIMKLLDGDSKLKENRKLENVL
jgi:phosphohistidine phosphatase